MVCPLARLGARLYKSTTEKGRAALFGMIYTPPSARSTAAAAGSTEGYRACIGMVLDGINGCATAKDWREQQKATGDEFLRSERERITKLRADQEGGPAEAARKKRDRAYQLQKYHNVENRQAILERKRVARELSRRQATKAIAMREPAGWSTMLHAPRRWMQDAYGRWTRDVKSAHESHCRVSQLAHIMAPVPYRLYMDHRPPAGAISGDEPCEDPSVFLVRDDGVPPKLNPDARYLVFGG
eukprot:gene48771-34635_t